MFVCEKKNKALDTHSKRMVGWGVNVVQREKKAYKAKTKPARWTVKSL